MEYKEFKITEFKADEQNAGIFTGYLAVFGNKDLGGDVIQAGAFAKTLQEKKGKVPLLDSHDEKRRLGYLQLEEDTKGLKITKGVLNLSKPIAQEAYADLLFYQQNEMPLGLSICYDAIKREYRTEKDSTLTRVLQEVRLWEGSIVTIPMNPKAVVGRVKTASALTKEEAIEIISAVRNVLSVEEIKALLGLEVADIKQGKAEPAESHSVVDFSWLKQYQK